MAFKKKFVPLGILMVFVFSIGMLTLAFNIQPANAGGTVYIRADGSIDPPTAPIRRDGDLYTLLDNVNDSIVVSRDNVVVDGAGYTVRGAEYPPGSGRGIQLSSRRNVTIKNMKIKDATFGISLSESLNNTLFNNNISNTERGIHLWRSSYNSISKNNIIVGTGISIGGFSSYNSISDNNITALSCGIQLGSSGDDFSLSNQIYQNNITNSRMVFFIYGSSNNEIYRNNFINNTNQVIINQYGFTANTWDDSFPLGGNYWSDYSGVDEKSGLNQDQPGSDGIGDTPYIIDANNRDRYPLMSICKAWVPTLISISTSSQSTLLGFTVNITGTLSDFYGNPLVNKTVVLQYSFPGVYTWVPLTSDITDSLGHFSVVWVPSATGYFTIKAEWAGNATHYVASNSVTLSTIPHENRYVFSVESNSTISALAFNTTSRELRFNASGPSGTRGYVKITIAKTLIDNISDVAVYLDGDQLNYTATSLDDSWLLHFTYLHSVHKVAINLGRVSVSFGGEVLSPDALVGGTLLIAGASLLLIFIKRRQIINKLHPPKQAVK